MKQLYKSRILFTTLLILSFLSIHAQTYVKSDATGTNNGTSWADAYTNLETALNNSNEGDQIWVAAGTYLPDVDSTTIAAFFTFPHDLELYGGFAGTETSLSERDVAANETILSGDHNSDDVDDIFDNTRSDNSIHVMWLTDTITNATIIDGLTIRNGNTLATSDDERRGGGILTYGAPIIRNCTFTQNYGYFGGGLYPRGGGADNVEVENCTFLKNTGNFGAGIYVNAPNADISASTFTQNVCQTRGGGIYNNSEGSMTITNCTFTDNDAEGSRGGGIYNTSSPVTIVNCDFTLNSAPASSGGAVQFRTGDDDPFINVVLAGCTFDNNNARFGGAVGNYDEKTVLDMSNCTFTNNYSENVGGGLSNAFGATSNITDCTFTSNNSDGSGGAIFSQNDSAFVNVQRTTFSQNQAETGGAIAISGDDVFMSNNVPQLNIQNSFLSLNVALVQGAGINLDGGNADISNCLISDNFNISTTPTAGGGMSINASDSVDINVNIINTTIANNSAMIGAGIAHFTAGIGTAPLVLQNTVFLNDGNNYEIESGNPTVTSNGGNLSSDLTMNSFLVGTNDLPGVDPQFVDASSSEFELLNTSPCINSGIDTGAPITDILGNMRVGEVDMGAYEYQGMVNIDNLNQQFGKLDIIPNPVSEILNIVFENEWKKDLTVKVIDSKGVEIFIFYENKSQDIMTRNYNVRSLPKGVYFVSISNGEKITTQRFVK